MLNLDLFHQNALTCSSEPGVAALLCSVKKCSAPQATGPKGTHWPLYKEPSVPQLCNPKGWKSNCSTKDWL